MREETGEMTKGDHPAIAVFSALNNSMPTAMQNQVTGQGTELDQASYDRINAYKDLTNDQLESLYGQVANASKVVNIPSVDIVRPWREITDDELNKQDQRFNITQLMIRAMKMARLFGASWIIPKYSSGTISLTSLRPESVGFPLIGFDLVSSNLWEVSKDGKYVQQIEVEENRKTKRKYHVSWTTQITPNIIILEGKETYASVLQQVVSRIIRGEVTEVSLSDVLRKLVIDHVSTDIIGQCNKDTSGNTKLYDAIAKRAAYVKRAISAFRMLYTDKTSETFERHVANIRGTEKYIDQFANLVAEAADIPRSRFRGETNTGLNSNDVSIVNYYDRLAGDREELLTPATDSVDWYLYQDLKKNLPEKREWKWNPIRQLSAFDIVDISNKAMDVFTKQNNLEVPGVTYQSMLFTNRIGITTYSEEELQAAQDVVLTGQVEIEEEDENG